MEIIVEKSSIQVKKGYKESHNALKHTRLLQNLWGDPPLAVDNTKNEKRIIHLLQIEAIHLYFTEVAAFVSNKLIWLYDK